MKTFILKIFLLCNLGLNISASAQYDEFIGHLRNAESIIVYDFYLKPFYAEDCRILKANKVKKVICKKGTTTESILYYDRNGMPWRYDFYEFPEYKLREKYFFTFREPRDSNDFDYHRIKSYTNIIYNSDTGDSAVSRINYYYSDKLDSISNFFRFNYDTYKGKQRVLSGVHTGYPNPFHYNTNPQFTYDEFQNLNGVYNFGKRTLYINCDYSSLYLKPEHAEEVFYFDNKRIKKHNVHREYMNEYFYKPNGLIDYEIRGEYIKDSYIKTFEYEYYDD